MKPKQRPRLGRGHAYTPRATREYEEWVAWNAIQSGVKPTDRPASLSVIAYRKPPRRSAFKEDDICVVGSDADNLIKAIADALNGIAWLDDSRVYRMEIEKRWGEPRAEITITYV